MRRVLGRAQHYDWGDTEALPRLLGLEPDGRPWAEWWWGTHPTAPSDVAEPDGTLRPLEELTGTLPFLVKLLAAARPLSLQVHPSADQAAEGFAREEGAGIAPDDPRRSYPDPHPKPELLCALGEFEALCGVAPVDEAAALLGELGSSAESLRARLLGEGPGAAIAWLLRDRPDIAELVDAASDHPDARCAAVVRGAELHPGDPASPVALLLHHVVLQPGEALFLEAGNLHAYLRGVGLEVMGASDNVLRCGWTTKHVDVDEMLRVLDPAEIGDPTVHALIDGTVATYPSPGAPFVLRRYAPVDGDPVEVTATGPELWWSGGRGADVLLPSDDGVAVGVPAFRVSSR